MATKRAKKHQEEEHVNHERWLVTYADMLTLLMVLFIVMFAISQVDQKKFNALRNGLAVGFGAPTVAVDGGTGPINDRGERGGAMEVADAEVPAPKPSDTKAVTAAVAAADRARQEKLAKQAEAEATRLEEIQKRIDAELTRRGIQNTVRYDLSERGLSVIIVTNKVIFDGDSAVLRPDGAQVIDAVGSVLRGAPNDLVVEGHTNHLGVANPLYPTLWELSVARASTVVRRLISAEGISPARLEAAGFGKERPLYPPSDPRAITLNRRVEIIIQSTLPPESRALLPKVASTHR